MVGELLKPVLVLVVAFLLKLAFAALNLALDEAVVNSIVLAIVTWLLAQISVDAGVRYGLLAPKIEFASAGSSP